MKNTNVKRIKADKKTLFRYWLEFLRPYHKLKPKEIEALSLFLYYQYELSLEISNPDLVQSILFSSNTRSEIRKNLGGMNQKVFNNLLSSLRKKKVLSQDNIIMPALIPQLDSTKGFKLIFNFEPTD